jgi:apolipoprotein N-acyltransferase
VQPRFPLQEFADTQPWLARFIYFLLGAATMLAFAPADAYALALVPILAFLYACLHSSPRLAAHLGFAFGAGLFLTGTYWLYVSIHVFGEAPKILAIFLMIALVIIMAIYYGATGWIIASLCRGSAWRLVAIAPVTWVSLEWLRGWFLSGFPWMTIGYSQIDSPLAGFAPLTGVFGVSFMFMISAAAILAVDHLSGRSRGFVILIAVLPWLAGAGLSNISWTSPAGPAVRTTIVQGGVSQDQKWLREQFQPTLDLYRESLFTNADSDLVIWPEVAVPAVLDQVGNYVSVINKDAIDTDTTLLFGILERDAARENVYNSVVALSDGSPQIYRKRHLVPFGEYFPVPDFVRSWMRMMNLPYSDISAGDDVQPLLTMPDGNKLSVAICYEDAYGAEQLYAFPDATILVNVSNDAWFGDSIAPHQHLQIARMRALEAGRYVVRATNNGVSAFIGPDGRLIETGPQFDYATMTYAVVPHSGMTPYAKTGNWPVIAFSLVVLGWSGWHRRNNST